MWHGDKVEMRHGAQIMRYWSGNREGAINLVTFDERGTGRQGDWVDRRAGPAWTK